MSSNTTCSRLTAFATSLALTAGVLAVTPGEVGAIPIEDRTPELLADINTNRGAGVSRPLVTDDFVYVTVTVEPNDGSQALDDVREQLWRVDRITEESELVIDIDAGFSYINPLFQHDGHLVLDATNGELRHEPHVVNESTLAVSSLGDLNPDGSSFPGDFFVLDDTVFFSASTDAAGSELWTTDLTVAGTTMVVDHVPGTSGLNPGTPVVVPVSGGGEAAYFSGHTVANGRELIRFDAPSTITELDLRSGALSSQPSIPQASSDGAVYTRALGTGPYALWRISAPAADPTADAPIEVQANLTTFSVFDTQVWASSNTDLSTIADKDASSQLVHSGPRFSSIRALDGRAVLRSDTVDGAEVWVSDGTDAGTQLDAALSSFSSFVAAADGSAVLSNAEGVGDTLGAEPWISTGVPGGTARLADLFPGLGSSQPGDVTAVDGGWHFLATDGSTGSQLWFTDGTSSGTRRLTDLGSVDTRDSNPNDFAAAAGATFFSASTDAHGEELWRHDPITGEVALVKDIEPGNNGSRIGGMTPFGDRVVFRAETTEFGSEPWISDGTASGTVMLADTDLGSDRGGFTDPTILGDDLFFIAEGGLWVVRDGASVATELVASGQLDAILAVFDGALVVQGFFDGQDRLMFVDPETGAATSIIEDIDDADAAVAGGVLFVSVSSDVGGGGGSSELVPSAGEMTFRVTGREAAPTEVVAMTGLEVDTLVAGEGEVVAFVEAEEGDRDDFAHSASMDEETNRWFAIAADGTVTPVDVPDGEPITQADFYDAADESGGARVFDGAIVFSLRRGVVEGGDGSKFAAMTGGSTAQLVAIKGGTMTALASFPNGRVDIAGVHGDALYFASENVVSDELAGGVKRAIDPDDGVQLWRTTAVANAAVALFDYLDFDMRDVGIEGIHNSLLYAKGDLTGVGVEGIVLDLGPVPDAPTGVMAVAGDGEAVVSWNAPVDDGGTAVTEYVVTAEPGGATCTTTGATTCTVTGLSNGTAYTFTVVAANAERSSAPSTASAAVTPTDPDAGDPEVVSLTPGRVLDTRPGESTVDDLFAGEGRVEASEFIEVDIAGRAGVADDAKSVVMNITAINPSGRGFLTTYPCETRPLASSLNYGTAGAVVGNELVAKLSSDGSVCVFTSTETHLTVDVVGFVPASSRVVSVEPGRVYATRASDETVDGDQEATGRIPAGEFVEVEVAGRAGVAVDAKSVVMNITAINPSGRGFLTTYPCETRPLASSLNFGTAGAVVGNELVAKLSDEGTVCVFSSAETDLTVDVVGYVPTTSAAVSLDPGRVYATRSGDETVDGEQQALGQIPAGEFVEVEIAGRAGVPASGAGAVVMNITAINPSGRGFMTTYPCETRPLASSLNYGAAGAVVGNELVAKLSDTGTVCIYTSAASDLTVDVVGYVPT